MPFRSAITEGQKRCVTCGESKPVDDFNKRKDRNMAPLSSCRDCAARNAREWQNSTAGRNARYLKRYGVTVDWYTQTLAAQAGKCAICRRSPDPSNRVFPRLVIDHSHETGEPRGLLCASCNAGLGRAGDEWVRLQALVRYLGRPRSSTCPPPESDRRHTLTPTERARRWKYAKKYGVNVEWYEATLAAQEGRCATCRGLPGGRRLAVDHDHGTGEPRGLLCTRCNQALGFFGDDTSLLQRAIEYLKRPAVAAETGSR